MKEAESKNILITRCVWNFFYIWKLKKWYRNFWDLICASIGHKVIGLEEIEITKKIFATCFAYKSSKHCFFFIFVSFFFFRLEKKIDLSIPKINGELLFERTDNLITTLLVGICKNGNYWFNIFIQFFKFYSFIF